MELLFGTCDVCNERYEVSSRDGRCGDCGNCSLHCCEGVSSYSYAVTYRDELASFFTIVSADDFWHARRVADLFFYDHYGLDVSLLGGDSVKIVLEGSYA